MRGDILCFATVEKPVENQVKTAGICEYLGSLLLAKGPNGSL